MNTNVTKNYLYNLIYQIAVLIIPLITAPYLSRILGAEGIGVYSYNYSIAYYFCLFVMLGVNNYGNRSIAKCLGLKERINRVFCEIFYMQFIIGIIVMIVYLVYALLISENSYIALCYTPFLISYMLDVTWLFFGQEDFKIILIRNLIVKVITALAIFTLVKNQSDVIMYILIMSIGALLSQLIVWPKVLKENRLLHIKNSDVLKHLKPNIILFIPVIAVSIYRTMDKIMLGSMSTMIQVGYYENSEKLISILLSFITALGTVMLPRMSALYESKDDEQIQKMLSNSIVFVSFAASLVSCGVASIATNLVVVYYGKEYIDSGIILQLLCVTVPCISYANIVRMQILVPQGKDKAYVLSCFVGAIINLVFNTILIPSMQGTGAAIGTIAAETSVLITQIAFSKEKINLKYERKTIICVWLNAILMFAIVTIIGSFMQIGPISLLIQIFVGTISYIILFILQWKIGKDPYINVVVGFLNNKIRKRI